jgi:Na+/proline symporter
VLATLAFNVAHCARPWPWIITGLATVILYPNGIGPNHDHEGRVRPIVRRPAADAVAWFMMAGFAAAYMSTVATQLNWGASYLVNDDISPIPEEGRDRAPLRRRVAAATVVSFLLSTLVTWQLSSVEGAWKFLLAIGAGTASC